MKIKIVKNLKELKYQVKRMKIREDKYFKVESSGKTYRAIGRTGKIIPIDYVNNLSNGYGSLEF